jgi:hypothetical protein
MQNTIFRHKPIADETEFTIEKTVELPLITDDKNCEGEKTTFLKGGKLFGQPVLVQIIDAQTTSLREQGEAVLVRKPNGNYFVPLSNLSVFNNPAEPAIITEGIDAIEGATTDLKNKKILGFTLEQLLLIGVMSIVITKILK